MSRKLYVGGLPYSMTDERLQEMFAAHGNVESAKVVTDRASGQSRGFGFVEFATVEEARKAIDVLNNTELEGRALIVNVAKPKGQSGRRSSHGGGRNRW